jgi:steroid delta-isomerase-like uncharacterized protein
MLAAAISGAALMSACQPAADADKDGDSTVAATTDGGANSIEEANKTMVRQFMEEVFNKGNTAYADQVLAVDFVERTPSPGQEQGLAGFKKMMEEWRKGMPDMKVEILDVMSDGDRVIAHVRQSGTMSGEMMPGMPPGKKAVDVQGVDIVRFKDGKAVEHWGYYEEMKMMQQLGMMPPMGGAADSTTGAAPGAAPKDTSAAKAQ